MICPISYPCFFFFDSIDFINFAVHFYIFVHLFSEYIAEQKVIQYAQDLLS